MKKINRLTKFLLGNHLIRAQVNKSQVNKSKFDKTSDGFTLIEILVAMIIAALVITPLLGFMINILDTDRKESAKESSEQEIQSALDYIARDLQQAVYIYEPSAWTRNYSTNTNLSGIKNQIPPRKVTGGCNNANECKPILVFWKREFKPQSIQIANNEVDDSFVYSLVAYYVINDNSNTWSKSSRIARFQIRDGVRSITTNTGSSCTGYPNDEKYVKCPDDGFQLFDLSLRAKNIHEKMNSWQANNRNYNQNAVVLIDFVDQTPISNANNSPNRVTCPSGTTQSTAGVMGFYACVDHENTTATVFLRGNALVRLQNKSNVTYSEGNQSYFPQVSRQVEGRGFLFSN